MSKRTKVISFIAIILAIIIIFGVGIGLKQGWFAGLADVISPPGPVNVVVEIKDIKGDLINGVDVYITKPQTFEKESGSVNCTPDGRLRSNSNPIARPGQEEFHRGKTGEDGENGIKRFTVNDAYNVNYLRLSEDMAGYKSCAFVFFSGGVSPAGGNVNVDGNFDPKSVTKFWNIKSENNQTKTVTINYTLRADTGGEPPVEPPPPAETGEIVGYVKTIDPKDSNKLIGVAGVTAKASNNQSGVTDENGKYTISELNLGASHKISFQYNWECRFEAPSDINVALAANGTQSPTVDNNAVVLRRGNVPIGKAVVYGNVSAVEGNIYLGPVKDARVTLSLGGLPIPDLPPVISDDQGYYQFCPVEPGNFTSNISAYNLSAVADGYQPFSKIINNVYEDSDPRNEHPVNLQEVSPEPQVEKFSIIGIIIDASTEKPLPEATIALVEESGGVINQIKDDGSLGDPASTASGNDGKFELKNIPINLPGTYLKATKGGFADGGKNMGSGPFQNGSTVDVSQIYLSPTSARAYLSGSVTLRVSKGSIPAGTRIDIFVERETEDQSADIGYAKTTQEATPQNIITTRFPETGVLEVDSKYIGQRIKICARLAASNGQTHIGCFRKFGESEDWLIVKPNERLENININVAVEILELEVFVREKGTNISIPEAEVTLEVVRDNQSLYKEEKTTGSSGDEIGTVKFNIPPGIDFRDKNLKYKFTASKDEEYSASTLEVQPLSNGETSNNAVLLELEKDVKRGYVEVDLRLNEVVVNWDKLTSEQKDALKKFFAIFKGKVEKIDAFSDQIIKRLGIDSNPGKAYPFIKEDFVFGINVLGDQKTVTLLRSKWQINHSNSPGTKWDDPLNRLNRGKSNPENGYTVLIPLSSLPNGFETMKIVEKRKALAAFFTGMTMDIDGDTWLTYSASQILKPNDRDWIDCSKAEELWKCRVRVVFPYTVDPKTIDFFKLPFELIPVEPIQSGTVTTSISATTDKNGKNMVVSPIGLQLNQIKGGSAQIRADLIGSTLLKGLSPGSYQMRTVPPRMGLYRVKSSASTFDVAADQAKQVPVELCYTENAYRDNGGKLKILGEYQNHLFVLLDSASKRAGSVLAKAGVGNLVYLGNNTAYGNYYSSSPLSFCQIKEGGDTTQTLNGRTIVVTDGFLDKSFKNYYGDSTNSVRAVAAMINYESAQIIYQNELSGINKEAWSNIITAANTVSDETKLFQAITEAGWVDEYITEDFTDKDAKLYAYVVAAMDNSAMMEQRSSGMDVGARNVLKAMLEFVDRTINNRSRYDTVADLTNVPLEPKMISEGHWLRDNYKTLTASEKIGLQYAKLISSVRNAKSATFVRRQIQAFNNWVDGLLGRTERGKVKGVVLREGEVLKDAIVNIGGKVGKTNSQGQFEIKQVPVGSYEVIVNDQSTGNALSLRRPSLKADVYKNQTSTITIRLLVE